MPPVATPSPDLRSRAGLTVVDGRSPSLSSHDVPAGLRMVRALDRAVLEAARRWALRPMELYALLLLRSEEPLETTRLAAQLAASQSQAKQIALRLCARGLAVRYGAYGRTELTAAGRELADAAASDLEDAVAGRMATIDPALRVLGTATLADLTLPTSA
jgi:DNA-binding MarR family transcriptional regulator